MTAQERPGKNFPWVRAAGSGYMCAARDVRRCRGGYSINYGEVALNMKSEQYEESYSVLY